LKAEAYRLGFHLVGVTTPQPPPHFSVFENWLLQGRHGEMDYLATGRSRRCRAAPNQVLPECESILVLGIRYPAPLETTPATHLSILSGRVASYAWGEDYHDVLAARLEALVNFTKAMVGHPVPSRWYTDTGPIMERDLAQRAGLGWIGKNTCLINPHLGSYFFLAEILLGVPLQPDQPFSADHCGSCTRCIEACPTACILPDRTLDASRCISYLTIELKGPIPKVLRPLANNWVFGCDICQQVCPWNSRAIVSGQAQPFEPVFTTREDIPQPDLNREIKLSTQAFNLRFRGSSVKRAKCSGYLRNVAVALGNTRNPAAVPDLIQALTSEPDPLVRRHAAWALGQIGGPTARRALQQAVKNEMDPEVRLEIRDGAGLFFDHKWRYLPHRQF
jgi:epoxyqueuosine reductase